MHNENDYDMNDDTLPILEPLMPGEDAPSSRPPDRDESYQNAKEKVAEIFAQTNARKGLMELNDSLMEGKTLVLLGIFLVLFCITMEFMPHWLIIPMMIMPPAFGIGMRMFKQNMPFQKAVGDCKVHIVLSICFLVIGIMCLLDS